MIKDVLKLVDGGIRYLTLLQKTRHVRRLRKAVDKAEDFILLSRQLLHEKDLKKIKRIKLRMKKLEKHFFKLNQG